MRYILLTIIMSGLFIFLTGCDEENEEIQTVTASFIASSVPAPEIQLTISGQQVDVVVNNLHGPTGPYWQPILGIFGPGVDPAYLMPMIQPDSNGHGTSSLTLPAGVDPMTNPNRCFVMKYIWPSDHSIPFYLSPYETSNTFGAWGDEYYQMSGEVLFNGREGELTVSIDNLLPCPEPDAAVWPTPDWRYYLYIQRSDSSFQTLETLPDGTSGSFSKTYTVASMGKGDSVIVSLIPIDPSYTYPLITAQF